MAENKKLDELLEKARHHVMTPEEKEAQRQSWLRGEMGLDRKGDEGVTTVFPPEDVGDYWCPNCERFWDEKDVTDAGLCSYCGVTCEQITRDPTESRPTEGEKCSDCRHDKLDDRFHFDAPGDKWGAALHWFKPEAQQPAPAPAALVDTIREASDRDARRIAAQADEYRRYSPQSAREWELRGWETTNPELVRSDGYKISLRFSEYHPTKFLPFDHSKGYWCNQSKDTSRPHKQIVEGIVEALNESAGLRAERDDLKRQLEGHRCNVVEDGFGSVWGPCPEHGKALNIMRPGKATCSECELTCYNDKLLTRAEKAESENRELREALKPFAELGLIMADDDPDEPIYGADDKQVNAEHFQAAARATQGQAGEEKA